MKIGVVELGNMGGGIARNFRKAVIPLMVWDLAQAAREPFHETAGVEVAPPARARVGRCVCLDRAICLVTSRVIVLRRFWQQRIAPRKPTDLFPRDGN